MVSRIHTKYVHIHLQLSRRQVIHTHQNSLDPNLRSLIEMPPMKSPVTV